MSSKITKGSRPSAPRDRKSNEDKATKKSEENDNSRRIGAFNVQPPTTTGALTVPLIPLEPSGPAKVVMRRFAMMCLAKGVESILQEFHDLKKACPTAKQVNCASFERHPAKNRYKDIVCIEDTRVILRWPVGTDADYIHANWIKGVQGLEKDLICTQAPRADTSPDFWRMVWQEKAALIVMLCQVMEKGKKKCDQYWPKEVGEKKTYGGLTICNERMHALGEDLAYTKLIVTGKSRSTGQDGTKREHTVNHVLWSGWPDKGVPLSSVGAIRVILRTQTYSPSIVHCSAGVGRTGTIVAIEASLRILDAGSELSVYNVVKELRKRRYLACQTDLQYLYVHRALIAFIASKGIITPAEVEQFLKDYEAAVKKNVQQVD
ncbi:Protein T27A3.5 [Aphelenchoides avenae]|nr:Protein T27A3.5 [Aphelenchus avenae]